MRSVEIIVMVGIALHIVAALVVPLLVRDGESKLQQSLRLPLPKTFARCFFMSLGILLLLTVPNLSIRLLLLLTLLNLLIEEQYPFSNYPMYYRFSACTYYLRVTDAHDTTIPLKRDFGFAADYLKQIYHREARSYLDRQSCADELPLHKLRETGGLALDFITQQWQRRPSAQQHDFVKLYFVRIAPAERELAQTRYLLGTRMLGAGDAD
ncbi:MAG: hypothetical protein ACPGWR_01510 [Ardenticatenaceae bacterium]